MKESKLKTINLLLKIGQIIAFISLAVYVVLTIVYSITLSIKLIKALGSEDFGHALWTLIRTVLTYIILIIGSILSLFLNKLAFFGFNLAKTKEDVQRPAVYSIFSGLLVTIIPLVAGIIALCTNSEDYNVIDVEVEEK